MLDKYKSFIKKNKIVVLATADSDGQPRAIFAEVNKVEDDQIIITDNEMDVTRANILQNPHVFVLVFSKDYKYLKIEGYAEYFVGGDYLEYVKNIDANDDFAAKAAVVVTVKHVEEVQ
jgi:uncharacterized pyridoxamine 5'-phosphate oxidase family protein